MRVTVERNGLVAAFGWVSRAIPSRPASPVLAGAKLTAADGVLSIFAFDYEQSAVARVPVSGDSSFVAVAPGRLLAELVRAIDAPTITMEVNDRRLTLKGGRSTFTVPLFAHEDYPSLPESPPRLGVVSGDDFADVVKRVAVAAGRDGTLPALTGVLVTVDPDEGLVTLAATDRYRLAVGRIPYTAEPGTGAVKLLVPAKVLEGYAKAVTLGSDIALLGAATGALFGVEFGEKVASTRMLDGEFPRYESLLPRDFATEVVMNVKDVSEALKRVSLVADRHIPVRCEFADGIVVLSSGSVDSADASEGVDVGILGEDMSIAFNPGYLSDGLAMMGGDSCRVLLTASNKPALLVPPTDDGSYRYLLMPQRV